MKLIKARKAATCHQCNSPINKGDPYVRRSSRIGRPQDSHMENIDGIPTMIMAGITVATKDRLFNFDESGDWFHKVCKQCGEQR